MAYITLPQTERTKSGLEAFSEAFTPGLEKAFQMALQRKMEEEQYRKTMERNKQMFPELFQEQITPQGYEQLKPFMRGIDQGGNISPEVALKEAEGRATQRGVKIPKQFLFNKEAMQPGMQVQSDEKGLLKFGYEKPDTFKLQKEEKRLQSQDLARANQLRREFIDRPEVKEYVTVKNKVSSMDALLKNALSGEEENKVALDQGLITLFNKITDPQSVVRESEYSRTPQNLSIANKFSGAFQKLQQGGAGLTDEDRKALVWGAKIIGNEQGRMFNERLSQYSDIAQSYGVDPGLVTAGVGEYTPYTEQPQGRVGWTPEKAQRLEELRRKRAEGSLGE